MSYPLPHCLVLFCFPLLQDIGRTTTGPVINTATREVSITYHSSTQCKEDPSQNYTSTIIFSCKRGVELVRRPPSYMS